MAGWGHRPSDHLPYGRLSQGGRAAAAGVPPGSALLEGSSDGTFRFREEPEAWKEPLPPSLLDRCPSLALTVPRFCSGSALCATGTGSHGQVCPPPGHGGLAPGSSLCRGMHCCPQHWLPGVLCSQGGSHCSGPLHRPVCWHLWSPRGPRTTARPACWTRPIATGRALVRRATVCTERAEPREEAGGGWSRHTREGTRAFGAGITRAAAGDHVAHHLASCLCREVWRVLEFS